MVGDFVGDACTLVTDGVEGEVLGVVSSCFGSVLVWELVGVTLEEKISMKCDNKIKIEVTY